MARPDAARFPVLQAVLTAFGQALGHPDIDPQDGLFDPGGDSLTATELAATFHLTVKKEHSPS